MDGYNCQCKITKGHSSNENVGEDTVLVLFTLSLIKKQFFLTSEVSLINTFCWRADHEIFMHDGEAGVH